MNNENRNTEELSAAPDWHLEVRHLNFYYGKNQVLYDNSIGIARRRVTTFIGPARCGKSTHVRVYNRLYQLSRDYRVEGQVLLNNQDILSSKLSLIELRQRVGMVFPNPTPFPMSTFDNVAYGLRLKYKIEKNELFSRVENALKQVSLWDELKNRLEQPAPELTHGQQQRLCIARTIAVGPEIILMDDPMQSIDHVSAMQIEELINQLKSTFTIVLVTQNMRQAARISDYTAFFYMGRIVEFNETDQIFTNPRETLTENYITGRFG